MGWRLFVPGGAEPVPFGPDLAAVLAGRELAEELPVGTPVPEVGQHSGPVRLPADEVRWAMGVEIEQHNVRLFWPPGEDLPGKAILLQSRDGLVKVVMDSVKVRRGADGALYTSRKDMKAAGVAADQGTGTRHGGMAMLVPELVTAPWAVAAEPGRPRLDAVLARLLDVNQRWERAPETRADIPSSWSTLAALFPDSEYEITSEFRHVRVARYPGLFAGAPLLAQLSVGVPLGGGVLAAMAELDRSMDARSPNAAAVHLAVRFGRQVARLYVAETTEDGLSPEDIQALTPDRDAVTVAEVMMLTFVLLSAVLRHEADPGAFMKKWMAVVPRQSLYDIWSELSPVLQAFFADRADDIRQLFAAEFADLFPDFAQKYNTARGQSAAAPVDLWNVSFSHDFTDARIGSVGELLDEILRPAPEGERFGPEDFGVGRADTGGLDGSDGSGPGLPPPLVVLEMRDYGLSKYTQSAMYHKIDYPMLEDLIGQLTGIAWRGEAAAAFAHQLPAAWKRPVDAGRNRSGEDKAASLPEASVIRPPRKIVWAPFSSAHGPGQRPAPAEAVLTTEHATGLLAGINAAALANKVDPIPPPRASAFGSLVHYITQADSKNFQPANITFDLLPALENRGRDRKERHRLQCEKALHDFDGWLENLQAPVNSPY